MRTHWLAEAPLTRRAMYRFFRDTKDYGVDILLLSMADHRAHGRMYLRRCPTLDLIRQMFDAYFGQHAKWSRRRWSPGMTSCGHLPAAGQAGV
jgi:hypothetical protein